MAYKGFDLTGRVALVTGGGSGLGHAIVAYLPALEAARVMAEERTPLTGRTRTTRAALGQALAGEGAAVGDHRGEAGQQDEQLGGIGKAEIAQGELAQQVFRDVVDEDHDQREATQRVHAQIAWKLGQTGRDFPSWDIPGRGFHRFGHGALFGATAGRSKRDPVKHV